MKKLTLQIFTLLISLSSYAQIEGTFKDKICEFGPDCFVYKFNKNGTFEYQYHQDILGSGTLTGSYKKIGDTLKLNPDKVLYSVKPKIIEKEYKNSDSTKIQIFLQRLAPKDKVDIDSLDWYVSINDGEYIETNENGMLLIPRIKIKKIELKDFGQVIFKNKEPMLKLTDSIFSPKTDKNYIEIFASESESNGDLAMVDWVIKTFILKGRKLYPLTFEPEIGFQREEKWYFIKFE